VFGARNRKTKNMIQQPPTVLTVTIADNAAISGAFQLTPFFGGIVIAPAAWIAANMGFQVCDTETGTYVVLRDDALNQPVQIENISTSAARAYKIPNAIFPAQWVKLWSKSATAGTETDVNQTGGPLNFTLMLK
jgi:hypothetical protein